MTDHLRPDSLEDPKAILAAASILAAARGGAPVMQLPEAVRPRSLSQAEAIQHATLQALGMPRGGWKVGRLGAHLFSAPMSKPLLTTPDTEPAIALPSGTRIELEIALRLRADLAVGAEMSLAALAPRTDLVVLLELVRSRFAVPAETTELERIADCISNQMAVATVIPGAWSPAIMEALPTTRLSQDGREIACHAGPHSAVPLAPLLEALGRRLKRERLSLRAGEIITLGSLTGVLPVPPEGARFRGEIAGLPPICCITTPMPETPA